MRENLNLSCRAVCTVDIIFFYLLSENNNISCKTTLIVIFEDNVLSACFKGHFLWGGVVQHLSWSKICLTQAVNHLLFSGPIRIKAPWNMYGYQQGSIFYLFIYLFIYLLGSFWKQMFRDWFWHILPTIGSLFGLVFHNFDEVMNLT
jgi:hypothetical protein